MVIRVTRLLEMIEKKIDENEGKSDDSIVDMQLTLWDLKGISFLMTCGSEYISKENGKKE